MIKQMRVLPRHLIAGAVSGALLLSACTDQDTYLPGVREDVRSVMQDPAQAASLDPAAPANTSRPISLGAPRSNANWPQSTGTQEYRVAHPALRGAPQLTWSTNIGAGDSRKRRITADPVVSNGRIFTLDAGAQVSATSTSGALLWTRDLTPSSDRDGEGTGGGLAVEGNTLYVSVGFGILAALDTNTGGIRWEQQLESSGSGTPTVSGDLVYLTSGDDTGWAVQKLNGKVQWQTNATKSTNNVLGAPAPAVTDQYAIFAFGSGEVQAVFRQGGLGRWNTSVVGRRTGRASGLISDVTSEPVVSGSKVYVGNHSGRLAALDLASGDPIWTAREGAIGPVWPAGNSIFAITDLNELVRLDAATGEQIWAVRLANFVKDKPLKQSEVFAHYGPIIAGGRVLVASNGGLLMSYDPTDGALLGTTEIPDGATTAPVVAGGTLYVVSTKGQLHAFR